MTTDWSPMLLELCQQVGIAMMVTYEQHLKNPMEFERKANDTPLTAADTSAHNALVAGLNNIDSSIPIISEESSEAELGLRKTWNKFWLIALVNFVFLLLWLKTASQCSVLFMHQ